MASQYLNTWVETKIVGDGYGVLMIVVSSQPSSLYDVFCYYENSVSSRFDFIKVASSTDLAEDGYYAAKPTVLRFSVENPGVETGSKIKLVNYPDNWKFDAFSVEYTIVEIIQESPLIIRVKDPRPLSDSAPFPAGFYELDTSVECELYSIDNNKLGSYYAITELDIKYSPLVGEFADNPYYRSRILYKICSTLNEAVALVEATLYDLSKLLASEEEVSEDFSYSGIRTITGD